MKRILEALVVLALAFITVAVLALLEGAWGMFFMAVTAFVVIGGLFAVAIMGTPLLFMKGVAGLVSIVVSVAVTYAINVLAGIAGQSASATTLTAIRYGIPTGQRLGKQRRHVGILPRPVFGLLQCLLSLQGFRASFGHSVQHRMGFGPAPGFA